MAEEVTAEEHLVHPLKIVTSKSRREGFEPTEEEAKELSVVSSQTISGSSGAHKENRHIALKMENQTGVNNLVFYIFVVFLLI
jgi:hypothetical protein